MPASKAEQVLEALRAAGLRPLQIWVPDMRSDEFRRLAHRESLAIARSRRERADQRFVDGFSVWT